MITTVLLSIGIVFLAELGDKSQLMALTFALRYRWWVVLSGIAVAAAGVHLLSVGVGHFLGASLPTEAIALLAAAIFLGVGVWTLREHLGGGAEEAGAGPRLATRAAPFFVVSSAFLLAELGDRTMFATAALATDYHWAGVWIGSTIGMVAADALAIALGILLGKHLPEHAIGIGSGLLFLYFGTLTGLGTLLPAAPTVLVALAALIVPAVAGAVFTVLRRRAGSAPDAESTPPQSTPPEPAPTDGAAEPAPR